MKKYCLTMLMVVLTALIITMQGSADQNLEKGKDRIDTVAIGSGLCVHNLFQSNMVLQRDRPIRVWGWAKPRENVTVSFGGNTQSSTAAADRLWKVELPALPASSEPQTMVVKGEDNMIELENMLVGDVWLLGGQSNIRVEGLRLLAKHRIEEGISPGTHPAQVACKKFLWLGYREFRRDS